MRPFAVWANGAAGFSCARTTEYLFTCNDTTCVEAMDGRRSIADIAGLMLETFEVNRTTLEADLVAVAEQLAKHGWSARFAVTADRGHAIERMPDSL
jgi:hypothetical protein